LAARQVNHSQVNTPVEACVALSSDRGSTPLASTIPIRKDTVLGVFFAFSVFVVVKESAIPLHF